MNGWMSRWAVERKDLLLEKRKAGREDRQVDLEKRHNSSAEEKQRTGNCSAHTGTLCCVPKICRKAGL